MNVDRKKLENIKQFTEDELDELQEEVSVSVFVKKKRPPMEEFTLLFQAVNLVLIKEMSPSASKVLLYFIASAQYGNYISKQTKWIAEDLNMSTRSVLRGINELENFKVIVKVPNPEDSRQHDYYLNPTQSWKGKAKERLKFIQEIEERIVGGIQLNLPFDDETDILSE